MMSILLYSDRLQQVAEAQEKLSALDERYKVWIRDSTARYDPLKANK